MNSRYRSVDLETSSPRRQPMSPDAIRRVSLARTWRGYDEREVNALIERVAADVEQWTTDNTGLRVELHRIKDALRNWQSADDHRQGQRIPEVQPSVEAVALLTRAQQQADSVVAQAHEYARQVTDQARRQADQLLRDAHTHAEAAAEQAVRDYRATAGSHYAAELEEVERRAAWLRSFAHAMQIQVQAASEAFVREVGKVAGVPVAAVEGDPARTRTGQPR